MRSIAKVRGLAAAILASTVLVLVLAPIVEANTPQPRMHLGRIWHNPEYDGAEGWDGSILQYPGGVRALNGTDLTRQWIGQGQKAGTYMVSRNFHDPIGDATFAFASSYFFRSMNYDYPDKYIAGDRFDHLYAVSVQEYMRFPRTKILVTVFVDNNPVEQEIIFTTASIDTAWPKLPNHDGLGARPAVIVDPTLVTEKVINMKWRYIQGVLYDRDTYGYAYGGQHQDYILQDITLTNDGIDGGVDSTGAQKTAVDAILSENPVANMFWAQAFDYRQKKTSLAPTQEGADANGTYVEPWGSGGNVVVLFSDGDDATVAGPDIGDPTEDAAYSNLLGGAAHVMYGPLFVSTGPGSDFDVNLAAQPSHRLIHNERGLDFAGKAYSPLTPEDMRFYLTDASYQMPLDQNYRDFPATSSITLENQGPTAVMGYGPAGTDGWTLSLGDQVRVVQVMAAGAINDEEGRRIGLAWNDAKASGDGAMTAADITLIGTGEDSVRKAVALAYWNFNGSWAPNVTPNMLASWGLMGHAADKAGRGAFDVPDGPAPPGLMQVRPGMGGGIEVRWTRESELANDHDSDVADFMAYKIYRQAGSQTAPWEVVIQATPMGFFLDAAQDTLSWTDANTAPGTDYWYSVVAVDDGTQNWGLPGAKLESTRWWTWTGYSAKGVTPQAPTAIAGGTPSAQSLSQNAPNPFNPSTVISYNLDRDQNDVSVVIYDLLGREVNTLVNNAQVAGNYSVTWNGTDSAGRQVGSGLYIARLATVSGTQSIRMLLVR